jgi:hypothetical protein
MRTPGAVAAVLLLFASACAEVPRVTPTPFNSRFPVLGPNPSFSLATLPSDWAVEGRSDIAPGQLELTQKDGVPALAVTNGNRGLILVRRIDTSLFVTPYLSWSWLLEYQNHPFHPVQLIIGFHGGTPESRSWGSQPFRWLESKLPPHDRALLLAWGHSALQRGTLAESIPTQHSISRYVVRGGRENVDTWWLETLDLMALYRKAWPNDDFNRSRIVFIGLAVEGGRDPSPAYISGIVLSR